MKEIEKKAVVTLTIEQIQRLRQIIMDNDKEYAIRFLKEVLKQINESANKSLNVGI